MIRILVINHYPLVRELYSSYLNGVNNFEVVGTSNGKIGLMDQIRQLKPDIVICGLYFGKNLYNGLNIITEIREKYKKVSILIISSYYSEKLLKRLGSYPNISFCHKSISLNDLTAAIHSINGGNIVINYSHNATWKDTTNLILGEKFTDISRRQIEILYLLSVGKSAKVIADEVGLAEATVIDHIKRMKNKLGAHTQCELIAAAFRNGVIV